MEKLGGNDPEKWTGPGILDARELAWDLYLDLDNAFTKAAGHVAAIENLLIQVERWRSGATDREIRESELGRR